MRARILYDRPFYELVCILKQLVSQTVTEVWHNDRMIELVRSNGQGQLCVWHPHVRAVLHSRELCREALLLGHFVQHSWQLLQVIHLTLSYEFIHAQRGHLKLPPPCNEEMANAIHWVRIGARGPNRRSSDCHKESAQFSISLPRYTTFTREGRKLGKDFGMLSVVNLGKHPT